jgi:hypothetical protein
MTRRMTKRARLEAALTGAPPDRAPAALWRHWPGDDQRPDTLARAVLDFQRAYDWDSRSRRRAASAWSTGACATCGPAT